MCTSPNKITTAMSCYSGETKYKGVLNKNNNALTDILEGSFCLRTKIEHVK